MTAMAEPAPDPLRALLDAITGCLFADHKQTAPVLLCDSPHHAAWTATCKCGWVADQGGDYLTRWTEHRDEALADELSKHVAAEVAEAERRALTKAADAWAEPPDDTFQRWLRDRAAERGDGREGSGMCASCGQTLNPAAPGETWTS